MSIGEQAMQQLTEKDIAHTECFTKPYPDPDAVHSNARQRAWEGMAEESPNAYMGNIERAPMSQVDSPSHYMLWPDTEVIDIIKKVLTEDELRGWMKGNSLKYRLRLGAKDNIEQDLGKAEKNEQWLGDLY